ncbi:MAG: hypothetical protein U9O82_00180 [Thermodesulfobacteriota bacterium]|nr:hypothetical protein [Thermodesulfobacteriota bacterium]
MNNEKTKHPAEDRITAFLVDPDGVDTDVRLHIENCPECLQIVTNWNDSIKAERGSFELSSEKWRRIQVNVWDKIERKSSRRAIFRPIPATATLSMLFVLVLALTIPSRRPETPGTDTTAATQIVQQVAVSEDFSIFQFADELLPESIYEEPVWLTLVAGNDPNHTDIEGLEEVLSILNPINGGVS